MMDGKPNVHFFVSIPTLILSSQGGKIQSPPWCYHLIRVTWFAISREMKPESGNHCIENENSCDYLGFSP